MTDGRNYQRGLQTALPGDAIDGDNRLPGRSLLSPRPSRPGSEKGRRLRRRGSAAVIGFAANVGVLLVAGVMRLARSASSGEPDRGRGGGGCGFRVVGSVVASSRSRQSGNEMSVGRVGGSSGAVRCVRSASGCTDWRFDHGAGVVRDRGQLAKRRDRNVAPRVRGHGTADRLGRLAGANAEHLAGRASRRCGRDLRGQLLAATITGTERHTNRERHTRVRTRRGNSVRCCCRPKSAPRMPACTGSVRPRSPSRHSTMPTDCSTATGAFPATMSCYPDGCWTAHTAARS